MNKFNKLSITGIILAGGQSSRMGQDKALITIKGRPMLPKICQLATEIAPEVYVITPWQERYQHILPEGCSFIREISFPGETKPHGPLVGFAQGLAKVRTEWVFLLACDLPQLPSSEVKKWTEYLVEVPVEAIALLPRHSKGWEPLSGFYRSRCLPLLNNFINQGGRSFQGWLAQHLVEELPITEPKMLFNCNTPADLEQLNSYKEGN
ncbi:MAG: molybdenum cofactor guanylyltransferase [Moorea sp. SIO2B7]|nr:molybdenum cofactor guanylyltransferase [Moorena sp. SIO2B7]